MSKILFLYLNGKMHCAPEKVLQIPLVGGFVGGDAVGAAVVGANVGAAVVGAAVRAVEHAVDSSPMADKLILFKVRRAALSEIPFTPVGVPVVGNITLGFE